MTGLHDPATDREPIARSRVIPPYLLRTRAAGSPGAVLYHKDGYYLLAMLGPPVLGYLEPVPGLPATASHLTGLATKLKGQRGVILRHAYQAAQGSDTLAATLGWRVHVVPLEPVQSADAEAYFALIEQWLTAIVSAKP